MINNTIIRSGHNMLKLYNLNKKNVQGKRKRSPKKKKKKSHKHYCDAPIIFLAKIILDHFSFLIGPHQEFSFHCSSWDISKTNGPNDDTNFAFLLVS